MHYLSFNIHMLLCLSLLRSILLRGMKEITNTAFFYLAPHCFNEFKIFQHVIILCFSIILDNFATYLDGFSNYLSIHFHYTFKIYSSFHYIFSKLLHVQTSQGRFCDGNIFISLEVYSVGREWAFEQNIVYYVRYCANMYISVSH